LGALLGGALLGPLLAALALLVSWMLKKSARSPEG